MNNTEQLHALLEELRGLLALTPDSYKELASNYCPGLARVIEALATTTPPPSSPTVGGEQPQGGEGEIRAVLREHHNWHLWREGEIDDSEKPDEMLGLGEYSDSGLCERTLAALSTTPPPSSVTEGDGLSNAGGALSPSARDTVTDNGVCAPPPAPDAYAVVEKALSLGVEYLLGGNALLHEDDYTQVRKAIPYLAERVTKALRPATPTEEKAGIVIIGGGTNDNVDGKSTFGQQPTQGAEVTVLRVIEENGQDYAVVHVDELRRLQALSHPLTPAEREEVVELMMRAAFDSERDNQHPVTKEKAYALWKMLNRKDWEAALSALEAKGYVGRKG